MKFVILPLMLFFGVASACPILIEDVEKELEDVFEGLGVNAYRLIDKDSEEPAVRYVINEKNGDVFVLEQKHCDIYNLKISILSGDLTPSIESVSKIGQTLPLTKTWNKYFSGSALVVLNRKIHNTLRTIKDESSISFISLTDMVVADAEHSEVILDFQYFESYTFQFRSQLTLTFSIGGI